MSLKPGEQKAASVWLPEDVVANKGRFEKHQRLITPSDFRKVFKTRLRSSDSQFLVLASENGLPFSRLGLAVSKDKLRKAVSRNNIKRLIRESFRTNTENLTGLDLVVLPQKKINISDRQTLRVSLGLHWRTISGAKTANNPD